MASGAALACEWMHFLMSTQSKSDLPGLTQEWHPVNSPYHFFTVWQFRKGNQNFSFHTFMKCHHWPRNSYFYVGNYKLFHLTDWGMADVTFTLVMSIPVHRRITVTNKSQLPTMTVTLCDVRVSWSSFPVRLILPEYLSMANISVEVKRS